MQMFRILLVEDNDDHAELLEMALAGRRVPCQVERARTGEEGLEYLRREGRHVDQERPDLILLDVNLPGLSGLEVLKQIKSADDLRVLPVIMVTTSNAVRDRNDAYQNHANSYLVKPMGFHELQEVCETLLTYWGTFNSRPEAI